MKCDLEVIRMWVRELNEKCPLVHFAVVGAAIVVSLHFNEIGFRRRASATAMNLLGTINLTKCHISHVILRLRFVPNFEMPIFYTSSGCSFSSFHSLALLFLLVVAIFRLDDIVTLAYLKIHMLFVVNKTFI